MPDSDVSTPLSKILTRLDLSRSGRDQFDTASLAFEAFLKYAVTLLLAGLRQFDGDSAYELEYRLVRAQSLGDWSRALRECLSYLDSHQTPQWLFELQKWFTKKSRDSPGTLSAVAGPCIKLQERLRRDGDESEAAFNNILDVVDFFVFVRNKTRGHGAKAEPFYEEQADNLANAVADLIRRCPGCYLTLGFRITSRFSECLWLNGPVPRGRGKLPPDLEAQEETALFVFPIDGTPPRGLPPLITYDMSEDRAMFANGGYSVATCKLEFIDYQSGRTARSLMPHYASEPVPRARRVKDVRDFPTDIEISGKQFLQHHDHRLFNEAAKALPDADWRAFELTEANAARIPDVGGVYCLTSHPKIAGLKQHVVLGYVGKASSLQRRFSDYLRERREEQGGRELVKVFLANFPSVHFTYTTVESSDDQTNLEKWLIKACDPPANTNLRIRRPINSNIRESEGE